MKVIKKEEITYTLELNHEEFSLLRALLESISDKGDFGYYNLYNAIQHIKGKYDGHDIISTYPIETKPLEGF